MSQRASTKVFDRPAHIFFRLAWDTTSLTIMLSCLCSLWCWYIHFVLYLLHNRSWDQTGQTKIHSNLALRKRCTCVCSLQSPPLFWKFMVRKVSYARRLEVSKQMITLILTPLRVIRSIYAGAALNIWVEWVIVIFRPGVCRTNWKIGLILLPVVANLWIVLVRTVRSERKEAFTAFCGVDE